ncbi:Short chain dehydrogenase [Psychromonas sp. psych-6C06]|uniref:SDR family oxidoreductase n=1 Tax=Psychromonas sp. psych-6C06 TaxID=2058089 RepID=UPI000C32FAC8|nr:SDR family oxidoreductase [Psychromonas sp. psych-6C06]PKF60792.1 Short chain dehydrogenase [Psychromonas sp. psych-6C06]
METVIITGANRGIGLTLATQFLAQGMQVIATCRDVDKATQLRALSSNANLSIFALEVTDEVSLQRFKNTLGNQPIDILINNAGIMGSEQQSSDDMDYDAWLNTFSVNTLAPLRLSNLLKGNLIASDNPRIISISSLMASLTGKGQGSYAYRSSKAALNKVMQVMALEYQADNITVCPVHPGWVRTDMGGSEADISVDESATGLVTLINALTLKQSGRFWQWDGQELNW